LSDPEALQSSFGCIMAYYGMIHFVDALFGEVLTALDQLGLRNDTLVIFNADHGELLDEHRLWAKQQFYEHSVRVPLIVSWPGVVPEGKVSDALIQSIDLYPTLLDFLGLPVPKTVQGKSFMPLLTGVTEHHQPVVYSELENGKVMQFDGRYKWIDNGVNAPEVYDTKSDPWEIKNLATLPEFRERLDAKKKELRQWLATDAVLQSPITKTDKKADRRKKRESSGK